MGIRSNSGNYRPVKPDLDHDGDVDGKDIAAFVSFFDPLTDQNKIAAVAAFIGYVGFPVDSDGDGIMDDGDFSGFARDNPCVAGETQLCDDNCPSETNTNQADADSNGVGDACDGSVAEFMFAVSPVRHYFFGDQRQT
jgi:hypothetical protein